MQDIRVMAGGGLYSRKIVFDRMRGGWSLICTALAFFAMMAQ